MFKCNGVVARTLLSNSFTISFRLSLVLGTTECEVQGIDNKRIVYVWTNLGRRVQQVKWCCGAV